MCIYAGGTGDGTYITETTTSKTFNTGDSTQIILYFYTGGQGSTSKTMTFVNVQLEEGTSKTSYTAYGAKPDNEEEYNEGLINWATNANIQAYKIVGGNLTYDANRDAELKAAWATQSQNIKNCVDGSSSFAIQDGVLMCWGRVVIIPVADTPTKATITFPKAFKTIPNVQTTPVTAVPGTKVTGTSATNITTTGCDVYITRTNDTETGVSWFAIGGIS
jgi:hypothetical protein